MQRHCYWLGAITSTELYLYVRIPIALYNDSILTPLTTRNTRRFGHGELITKSTKTINTASIIKFIRRRGFYIFVFLEIILNPPPDHLDHSGFRIFSMYTNTRYQVETQFASFWWRSPWSRIHACCPLSQPMIWFLDAISTRFALIK